MAHYRHKDARGCAGEVTVIEDSNMVSIDEKGCWVADFRFVDHHTIKAHPLIVELLLQDAERLWTLEEVLGEVE